jgi:D-alanyl-D-alanine carboxypeptidase
MKQAGIALIALTVILGGATFVGMKVYGQKEQTIVTQAVATSTPPAPDAYQHVSLIGKAAVVYDLATGETLYSQNVNAQLPLASVTKLLTLYAASQVLQPDSQVTMTPDALAQASDVADFGFKQDETFAYKDIARLTLAASSNAGAEAITEAASKSHSQDSTSLLASAATAIGLKQTYARNSTGLDLTTEESGSYGSAHDVALLAGALLKQFPEIAQASTQSSVTATSEQGIEHTFANTNQDVEHIPNLLLSKTGFTDLAGGNLVVVYDAGINHPVAIVVLGSTEEGRFTDVKTLLNATFAHFAGTTPSV